MVKLQLFDSLRFSISCFIVFISFSLLIRKEFVMSLDDIFTLILIIGCFVAFMGGWLIGLFMLQV